MFAIDSFDDPEKELRLLVLKIEFCPNMGKGVAVFAMFANIF